MENARILGHRSDPKGPEPEAVCRRGIESALQAHLHFSSPVGTRPPPRNVGETQGDKKRMIAANEHN